MTETQYDFVAKPVKIPWSKDISFRFENSLQSQEFRLKTQSFMESDIEQTRGVLDTPESVGSQKLSNTWLR